MAGVIFWIKRAFFMYGHFLFRCVLALFYCGKRKTIPPLKHPLLFKSATKLAEEIRKGQVKSSEVVQIYIDRIREVQPYLNAVVQERFYEALNEAREVDALIESGCFTEQQLEKEKPLLGVPFTVKVLLAVKGHHYTGASLLFKDRIANEDSQTVALVKKAGGIVMAITNSPEFGGGFETDNFLYGQTCNPYDTTKTCGGSSGGEGALISAGGSVIGLGNDVLGSIRIPAHYCGIFAHKASLGRVSNLGVRPDPHPSMSFMLYTGPMCRYSEDLITMMKILTAENDERFKPLPSVNFKGLKVYYQTEVNNPYVFSTDKEIVKALHNAASHFTNKYGAVSKEVSLPLLNNTILMAIYLIQGNIPDNADYVTEGGVNRSSGPLEVFKYLLGRGTFTFMTIFAFWLVKMPLLFSAKSIPFFEELNKRVQQEFNDLLDENSVFLYPTMPKTAPYHNESFMHVPSAIYSSVFNCTGMPVTQCPLGLSTKGLPMGIQIVGRKNNDALTLACAAELEKAFGGWVPPARVEKQNEPSSTVDL